MYNSRNGSATSPDMATAIDGVQLDNIMKTQCLCEKPVIILHPNAASIMINAGAYVWNGIIHRLSVRDKSKFMFEFPYQRFSPKRNKLTLDDIEDIYALDVKSGETKPIYLVVPCGKCDLCCYRKTKEMSFRCVCETFANKCVPLFVTLTYNDEYLPVDGVSKDDCQRFLKRLRMQLKRDGYDVELRYVLTSEYGCTGTHRPHYHLLIWNLPQVNLHNALKMVQRAWSYRANIKKPMGHVKVMRCTKVGYTLKYMYKHVEVPDGKNDLFHLMSRRSGGIGAGYLYEIRSYIEKNPDTLTVSCYDLCSNKVVTCGLPQYFKRKIFASPSAVIPKDFRDKLSCYLEVFATRNILWRSCIKEREYIPYTHEELTFLRQFQILDVKLVLYNTTISNLIAKYPDHHRYEQLTHYMELEKMLRSDLKKECDMWLSKYKPYKELRERRQIVLSLLSIPEIDLDVYAANVKEYNKRVELRRKL